MTAKITCRYVYECHPEFSALPTFAVIPAHPVAMFVPLEHYIPNYDRVSIRHPTHHLLDAAIALHVDGRSSLQRDCCL